MIDAQTLTAAAHALGGRYNGTLAQRARIVECLRWAGRAGVLSAELAASCNVPCITKRVSELRRQGVPIKSAPEALVSTDGTVTVLACYVLDEGPSSQLDLFTS